MPRTVAPFTPSARPCGRVLLKLSMFFRLKSLILLNFKRHNTISYHDVLEMIVTGKWPRGLSLCAQYAVTEGIWRQVTLVAMKTNCRSRLNVEDYLVCALSCIELRICSFPRTNKLSFRVDCSESCATKSCFSFLYFCSVHVQQLSQWRSCTVVGPWTLCLLIDWATCLKLRTPNLTPRWRVPPTYALF